MKITGKSGSVKVRLIPAPRGTGLVGAQAPKKILAMAGIEDVFTGTTGNTKTMGNFIKATFEAVAKTYNYLTPDLWDEYALVETPFQANSEFLAATNKYF
jgi:small subunit ribosomal protein S2e